jgi:hypothetical protein
VEKEKNCDEKERGNIKQRKKVKVNKEDCVIRMQFETLKGERNNTT